MFHTLPTMRRHWMQTTCLIGSFTHWKDFVLLSHIVGYLSQLFQQNKQLFIFPARKSSCTHSRLLTMKLSTNLLALSSLHTTAAFMLNEPIKTPKGLNYKDNGEPFSLIPEIDIEEATAQRTYYADPAPEFNVASPAIDIVETEPGMKLARIENIEEVVEERVDERVRVEQPVEIQQRVEGQMSLQQRVERQQHVENYQRVDPIFEERVEPQERLDINAIWETAKQTTVQGGALRTWAFDRSVERVLVGMQTDGSPLDADIELWQGANTVPQKMSVYIEQGNTYPFHAVIETIKGGSTVSVRNAGEVTFPLTAAVEAAVNDDGDYGVGGLIRREDNTRRIEGDGVLTYPLPPSVQSCHVVLTTDGRPLNAQVELLFGPTNKKQIIDVYTENGFERPFSVIIATPEAGNVIRIVNTGTLAFPITASVEPYDVDRTQGYGYEEYSPGNHLFPKTNGPVEGNRAISGGRSDPRNSRMSGSRNASTSGSLSAPRNGSRSGAPPMPMGPSSSMSASRNKNRMADGTATPAPAPSRRANNPLVSWGEAL